MKPPALLILTATITPPLGVPNLKRVDPALRLRDYLDAFRFYLSIPTEIVNRIVFLENSDSDISALRRLATEAGKGKQIEFVVFAGLNYPPSYGRAYGEFKMLDHGFTNSALLNELKEDDYFWKVTGRLKVFNLKELIQTAPTNNYQLLMDFFRKPTPMVDLRLFSCSRSGYRQLFEGEYVSLREDTHRISAEGECYLRWSDKTQELRIVPRHRRQPKIGGVGGQHNVEYYGGLNVIKHWVRVAARHLMPRLWI